MSFNEFLVIIALVVVVCRPEDIKSIIQGLFKLRDSLLDLKKDFLTPVIKEIEQIAQVELGELSDESIDEINFYIKKITSLNESYNGDYSLSEVKKYYHQLLHKK